MLGHANVIVAGGVESMSNAPNYTPPPPPRKTKVIPKAGNDIAKMASSASGQQVINGVLKDGFRDAYGRQEHMGLKGEKCASSLKIGREEQDEWTTESYERVIRAQKEGWFDEEIIPVTVASQEGKSSLVVDRDDEPEKVSRHRFLPVLIWSKNSYLPIFTRTKHSFMITSTNTMNVVPPLQNHHPPTRLPPSRRNPHSSQLLQLERRCRSPHPYLLSPPFIFSSPSPRPHPLLGRRLPRPLQIHHRTLASRTASPRASKP